MIKLFFRSMLVLFFSVATAWAANVPYKQAEFENLLQQNKPVVLHIHADWCPVCRAQQKVLDELMQQPEFKQLPVLRADFDKEKTLLRKYKVRNQSTFIIFKNGKEIERSTGETDGKAIAELLRKAL